ncbi:MAG: hypothetical protein RSD54_07080, partial [Ruthenibacterium sp.]
YRLAIQATNPDISEQEAAQLVDERSAVEETFSTAHAAVQSENSAAAPVFTPVSSAKAQPISQQPASGGMPFAWLREKKAVAQQEPAENSPAPESADSTQSDAVTSSEQTAWHKTE